MKCNSKSIKKYKKNRKSFLFFARKNSVQNYFRNNNRINVSLDCGITVSRLMCLENKDTVLDATLNEILLLQRFYKDNEISKNVYEILKEGK